MLPSSSVGMGTSEIGELHPPIPPLLLRGEGALPTTALLPCVDGHLRNRRIASADPASSPSRGGGTANDRPPPLCGRAPPKSANCIRRPRLFSFTGRGHRQRLRPPHLCGRAPPKSASCVRRSRLFSFTGEGAPPSPCSGKAPDFDFKCREGAWRFTAFSYSISPPNTKQQSISSLFSNQKKLSFD
jgi:hypothetical protein